MQVEKMMTRECYVRLSTFCCAKQLRKSGSDIRMKVYTCLTMFTECIQLIQANSTSNYIHVSHYDIENPKSVYMLKT